jgi:UTP--glucose-1-phosphate uridylyltransferase
VGDEPFAVLYGDDIIFSEKPVTLQLIESYEKYGRAAAGVKEVPEELVRKYCTLKTEPIDGSDNEFFVSDMIEKPGKDDPIYSHYSILGRVLLTPDVFDIIDALPPGAGGEIQLTDAMAIMARTKGVTALEFEGDRYDMGSKLGFLKANVVKGLSHKETAEDFREFIKEIAKTL